MNAEPGMKMTNLQVTFMVFGTIIGSGVLALPRVAAEDAAQDAWIAVLLGGVPVLFALLIINLVCRRFPTLTLVEIIERIFGRVSGLILGLLFVCYTVVMAGIVLRLFGDVINNYLLRNTPQQVVMAALLLAISYLAVDDLKRIGRANELFFYLFFPVYILLCPALGEAEILNLLPVGETGIINILKGSYATALSYTGIIAYMVIYPFISRQTGALRAGMLGVLFIILTYVFVVSLAIMVLGPTGVQLFNWPVIELLRDVNIPVLERTEMFFISIYAGTIFRLLTNWIFMSAFSFARLFRLPEHKYVVFGMLPLIYMIALWPQDRFVTTQLGEWIGIIGMAFDLLLPAGLLIGAILLKKRDS